MHRLDLGLYSHPKEFLGNGVRTHVNSKGKKNPLPEKIHLLNSILKKEGSGELVTSRIIIITPFSWNHMHCFTLV